MLLIRFLYYLLRIKTLIGEEFIEMQTTIYDLLVSIIGTPTTEYGEYALYIGAVFVTIFVLYSLLNLVYLIFRGMWGNL